ncbi:unnamed protein product [Sphagnum balticum]
MLACIGLTLAHYYHRVLLHDPELLEEVLSPQHQLVAASSRCKHNPLLQSVQGSNRPSLAKAETGTNSPLMNSSNSSKTVFVAGATGSTGKRIVKELLSKGFQVRAGVRDLQKAKAALPSSDNLEFVLADVTQSVELLAKAIGGVDAVIVATGFRPSFDLLASWKVDNWGTRSVVDACKLNQVKKIVLVSSILVNGAAIGQLLNPVYIILNIFGLTLVAKLQAENYIRKSGIDYTIIRPGGLKNDPPSGNIFLSCEDSLYEGAVSRDTVARVAVESVSTPEASYKVVELVEKPDAPAKHVQELFASVS